MSITALPWHSTFFAARYSLIFFNLMRATVSNILENIVPMLPVILSSSSVVMGTTTVEINQAGHW